jgi:hypothetical protein
MATRLRIVAATTLLVSASFSSLHADALSIEASDNATVQPGGPRSGSNGKAFLNVEGSGNGSFASYGVADFNFGSLPYPVLSVNSASLDLTESNAGFSTAGQIILSLDTKAIHSDIQPGGSSPLAFDGVDPGTGTDVGDGDLVLLTLGGGPFSFPLGTTGDVDTYTFTLDASTSAELVSRLNSAGTIRVVVGTGEAGVAATWAGYTNFNYDGPTLKLDVTYDTNTPTRPDTWGRIKSVYR